MKRIIIIIGLILIISQPGKSQNLGGGVQFGSETLFGAHFTYVHSLQEDFSFNFDALFFLPHTTSLAYVDHVVKRVELNGNYQYNLRLAGLTLFPYTGLNISHITTDKNLTTTSDQRLNTTESEFEIGLNIGTGIIVPLQKKFDLIFDGRYTFHDYDQLVIKGGILFNL